mgnify:FL=1
MKIEKTSWGRIITIPATATNSEFSYELREVRKINNNNPHEQELINRLEVPEQKAIRKLTILLFSMENFFKRTAEDIKRKRDVFQTWEERNRMDWNEWYHTQADLLEDEINGYSFEYAHNSKHGWCL